MEQRFLITGFSGFVARHFCDMLERKAKPGIEVMGIDLAYPAYDLKAYKNIAVGFENVDLLDKDRLVKVCAKFKPDYVLHLASFSSVAYSWSFPEQSFVNNTNIFMNLASALRETDCECRILSVGSSEEYGIIKEEELPISEDHALNPKSPYAAARVSQELLSKVYNEGFGQQIVMTRSFNHIGPWQDTRFAVPSFVHKMLSMKNNGRKDTILKTGNINVIRDFVDVRDVCEAYYLLLLKGRTGDIYNICSGVGTRLSDMIKMLADEIGIEVTTVTDPKLLRAGDNPVIVGSNSKICDEIGWKPRYTIRQTLRDIIEAMESE